LRGSSRKRAASALSHPNICHIYHLGETPDRQRYVAMEYVDGETLQHRLMPATRLPSREAIEIAIQVAAALTAAHAAGIVHRDIKPENVMIRRDRLVKVLDFGLAKLAPSATAFMPHGPTQTAGATDPGSRVGTLDYMSPEQARGLDVDARTDIWALGVVLYEVVAGRAPFTGATRSDVLVAVLDREPAPLARVTPEVPAELQRIVGKALRKDPERRYQVMKDLLLDLEALRDELASTDRSRAIAEGSTGASVQETTRPGATTKSVASRPRLTRRATLAAAALLLIALSGAAWWIWRPGTRRGRTSTESSRGGNYPYTRLTFGPGLQTDPAFSPDGKFIAYASDRAGNFDIWVQALSGGSEPVQVTRAPADDMQPPGRRTAPRWCFGLIVTAAVCSSCRHLGALNNDSHRSVPIRRGQPTARKYCSMRAARRCFARRGTT
jgi:eukaryotic-like serine/threonine-protein kinase